jgi:hypothetical protein
LKALTHPKDVPKAVANFRYGFPSLSLVNFLFNKKTSGSTFSIISGNCLMFYFLLLFVFIPGKCKHMNNSILGSGGGGGVYFPLPFPY